RSHSVAYAYFAFQTAYLKAHSPSYFSASVFSNEADDSTKIYKYSSELKSAGLKLLPPDVNESDAGFTPLGDGVRFGLSAIKGIGAGSVNSIIEARRTGRFTSLSDFTSRIEQGTVNRRGLESLAVAGAFDSLSPADCPVNLWRAKIFAGIDGSLSSAQKAWNDKIRGQNALFGAGETTDSAAQDDLPDAEPWTQQRLSQAEKAAVGFYLSNHPLDNYKTILEDLKIKNVVDLPEIKVGEKLLLAGIVSGFQARFSKKGNRFGIFKLEDQSTSVKCLVWSEAFARYAEILKDDELLIVSGKVESADGGEITLILEEAQLLDDAIPSKSRKVLITLPQAAGAEEKFLEDLFALLSRQPGKCDVYFKLNLGKKLFVRLLAQPLRIDGTRKLERELYGLGCGVKWELN
ncbi:MAG: OB-fold nucleic acid binding domain-containing protein, partial [Pyrinomonadaceae bacterium]